MLHFSKNVKCLKGSFSFKNILWLIKISDKEIAIGSGKMEKEQEKKESLKAD